MTASWTDQDALEHRDLQAEYDPHTDPKGEPMSDTRDTLAGWAPDGKLVTFARTLNEAGEFTRFNDVILFFEKPYNWHREYAAWNESGRPFNGDEGWDGFLARLAEL